MTTADAVVFYFTLSKIGYNVLLFTILIYAILFLIVIQPKRLQKKDCL